MISTRESHTQVVEVPQYWPKSAQEGDAKHHVPPVQWNGVAIHGKDFIRDPNTDVTYEATADDAIPIGHRDTSAWTRLKLQASAASNRPADKIVCGARI
jgi:hypothetical protein